MQLCNGRGSLGPSISYPRELQIAQKQLQVLCTGPCSSVLNPVAATAAMAGQLFLQMLYHHLLRPADPTACRADPACLPPGLTRTPPQAGPP